MPKSPSPPTPSLRHLSREELHEVANGLCQSLQDTGTSGSQTLIILMDALAQVLSAVPAAEYPTVSQATMQNLTEMTEIFRRQRLAEQVAKPKVTLE